MAPQDTLDGRLAVSVPRAGRLADVSARLIRKLVMEGRLPSCRVGRRRLILVADLQRLLEAGRQTGGAE